MRKLLSIVLLFSAIGVSAKNDNFILRAYVTRGDTTAWVGLDSVAVSISAVNDTASIPCKLISGNTKEQLTDAGGEIRMFVTAKPGKYMMTLDREGFEPLVKEFERKYSDQTAVWVGTLKMERERRRELNEVQVVATAIKMIMKGDTVVYNADAFNLAEGSMLESLVKQLPNSSINADGEITVNGRKINSLLINGKDFFNGDMDIAMKNLPSYTVQNIKVYDKAADDDYLTQASQKLDRDEQSENLVMDVVLKKEYSIGTMASVEAGYGTSKRYLAKAFVMGFTKDFRLTAFGNCNNTLDFATGSARDGWNRWGGYGVSGGDARVESGGIDYLYEPDNGKFKASGNAQVRILTTDRLDDSNATLFYPSGNLYRRSAQNHHNKEIDIKTDHGFHYKGDIVYLSARPSLAWTKNRGDDLTRSATFNSFPAETSRNEALDSLFARRYSELYNPILLTRLRTAAATYSENLNAGLSLSADMRFPSVPGQFGLQASGNYIRNTNQSSTIYSQAFGGANPNSGEPVNNDRSYTQGPKTGKLFGGLYYGRDWSDVDEQRRKSLRLNLRSQYDYTHITNDYNLFTAQLDSATAISMLPSMARPENALADPMSTYNSVADNHKIRSSAELRYNYESTAMVDSGFNPNYMFNFSVEHNYRSNHLDYNPLAAAHESVLVRTNTLTPSFFAGFYNSNKLYRAGIEFDYSLDSDVPSPEMFLRNRVSANPMTVYAYNGDNLKNALTHNLRLTITRWGRESAGNVYFYVAANFYQNQIGSASFYNPLTGVTVFKTMNINGNRRFDTYGGYRREFGREKQISLNVSASATINHSVDFTTTTTEFPEKSVVDNQYYNCRIGVGYKFKNGSTLNAYVRPGWRIATSERADFHTIRAGEYNAALDATVELPWQMQLTTDFRVHWNRGYELEEMNRAQFFWNAALTKSILKGNLTFKLRAYDILGQLRDYDMRVNAQGRYETWTNRQGRYVMLSVIYRFNKNPKKKN